MKNLAFIAVFVVHCTLPIWMVTGQNCTASDQPPYSNACIFECIKDFYDVQFCSICTPNTNPIKLVENDTLDSLLKYQFLRFDDKKGALISMPSCSNCRTEQTLDRVYEEYVQPKELMEFADSAYNLTVKPHHSKVNHTNVQRVHELHTNFTERFNETKQWCLNALGIAHEYELFVNSTESASVATEPTLPATNIETTTSIPANLSSETFVNQTTHQLAPNVSSNSTDQDDECPECFTTTEEPPELTTASVHGGGSNARNMPTPSIDSPSDTSQKSNTSATKKKNSPKIHDHHFNHSVAIVVIIAAILLILLIVSAVILGVYIKQRKKTPLTSSRTYVFDNHQS